MLKRSFSLGGGCKKDSVGHVAIRNEIERRKHGGSTSTAPWELDQVRVSQVSNHYLLLPPLIIVRHAWSSRHGEREGGTADAASLKVL